jgi:hypothetical protein
MAITLFVVVLERRPDLDPWHTIHLDEEFTASGPVESFDEYLALEGRLFSQLDDWVYAAVPAESPSAINRYDRGSEADPGRWPTNWNRTFQLSAEDPRAGVLQIAPADLFRAHWNPFHSYLEWHMLQFMSLSDPPVAKADPAPESGETTGTDGTVREP